MEELIALLEQLNVTLTQQIEVLKNFVGVLDQEEQSIASYNFLEIEKSVILKDQQTQLAQSLEEKRIGILKKICYMMAFDARGQNLSISLFKTVFNTYLQNIKKLVSEEIIIKLEKLKEVFLEITNEFYSVFHSVEKRINRNQIILKKIIKHVNLSLNLFQSEAEAGMNYDALGKAQTVFNQQTPVSSIRVTV